MISPRWLLLLSPLALVLACESATNLDVSYATPDGGNADAAGSDADPDAGEADSATPVLLEGCPCDQSAGFGCCVTPTGAFCTNDHDTCTGEKGEFLRCSRRDPSFESECCWLGSGAGATTRFAAACDGGPTACLGDTDCIGTGQTCKTSTCAGFTFGQCASAAPACP